MKKIEILPKERPDRNYEGVEHAMIKIEIDPIFNALHDALETAYYECWRKGEDADFLGYRYPGNSKAAKDLFDEIHGAIWHLYEIALAERTGNDSGDIFVNDYHRKLYEYIKDFWVFRNWRP